MVFTDRRVHSAEELQDALREEFLLVRGSVDLTGYTGCLPDTFIVHGDLYLTRARIYQTGFTLQCENLDLTDCYLDEPLKIVRCASITCTGVPYIQALKFECEVWNDTNKALVNLLKVRSENLRLAGNVISNGRIIGYDGQLLNKDLRSVLSKHDIFKVFIRS